MIPIRRRSTINLPGGSNGSCLATAFLRDAAYCILDAVLEPEPSDPPDYSTDPATWSDYTGLYEFMDNGGNFFQSRVRLEDGELSITFPNPDDPEDPYRIDLVQLYLDTFEIDLGDEGEFDLTFIDRSTIGPPRMWLRNRSLVGQRVPRVRRIDGRRMSN